MTDGLQQWEEIDQLKAQLKEAKERIEELENRWFEVMEHVPKLRKKQEECNGRSKL